MEGSVNVMPGASERPGNLAGIGIDSEGLMLCEGAGSKKQRQNKNSGMAVGFHNSFS
jgi:hypothetical protein